MVTWLPTAIFHCLVNAVYAVYLTTKYEINKTRSIPLFLIFWFQCQLKVSRRDQMRKDILLLPVMLLRLLREIWPTWKAQYLALMETKSPSCQSMMTWRFECWLCTCLTQAQSKFIFSQLTPLQEVLGQVSLFYSLLISYSWQIFYFIV